MDLSGYDFTLAVHVNLSFVALFSTQWTKSQLLKKDFLLKPGRLGICILFHQSD